MTTVLHADLELFLTGWLRAALAARPEPYCSGVQVDAKEPEPTDVWPERLVVIRSDGGAATSLVTDAIAVGVTVFAGTQSLPEDAILLAHMVRALLRDCAAVEPGNPVAAVPEATGPYRVPEDQPRARLYMTFVMVVVGTALGSEAPENEKEVI